MKKQLFKLIFTLLIGGLYTTAIGQIAPQTVTCLTSDALHPIAGTPYDYTITVPLPVGWTTESWDPINYNWFVTQDPTFFNAGTFSPDQAAEGSYFNVGTATGQSAYNVAAFGTGTTPTINITWHGVGHDPAKPVFLGILVTGTVKGGTITCSPHNLKVYKIEPQFSFTLDIDNLLATGSNHTNTLYGDNLDVCISDIAGAVYDATAPEGISYDYGQNTLYYEVIAANWFDRWQLSVLLGGLQTSQTATIHWANAPATRPITDYSALAWNAVGAADVSNGTYISSTLVSIQGGTTAVGATGESIIIRVVIKHNKFEGITDTPITLAVDGVLAHNVSGTWTPANSAEQGDIHTVAGPTASPKCPWFDNFDNDIAKQTIKARPNITGSSPALLPIK